MSGWVFVKHDRVRVTDGAYKDETGTIAADVPLSDSGALQHAPVLLDWSDHGGAKYIPLEYLERIPAPVDLTGVRGGLNRAAEMIDGLADSDTARAIDQLRFVLGALVDEVGKLEKLAGDGAR